MPRATDNFVQALMERKDTSTSPDQQTVQSLMHAAPQDHELTDGASESELVMKAAQAASALARSTIEHFRTHGYSQAPAQL